jgi:two-component system NtrC family sensor kinase
MSLSVAPLVVSLILAERIRRYARINSLQQWEKPLKYALFFSVFLISAEAILSAFEITKWIWHVYLIAMIIISLQQKEFRVLRMFIAAFIPYEIVSLCSDFIQLISADFFDTYETYFENATSLTYIWMAATLFSQNRQFKATEKEQIKRQQEDELNRAIAIRKVELEGLVAERTAELTEQKEELEQALDELRSTQSQLIQSEKMASLGELTAGIAHEIQNPLNFVNNFSEVNIELIEEMKTELMAGNNEEAIALANDIAENEKKITQHGKRADGIVKGMLQHSRSSSGVKEPSNINTLADEYLRLAYHGLRAKDKSFNASMTTDFDQTLGLINIIPQDIGRVILNLITNAFYAVTEKKNEQITGYEPIVSVSTKKINGKVEIKVTDNGNGIPQKALDKIFQPFFTTKPSGQGTGLGLSMSYEIVNKGHGGELSVETKEGEGAVFTIKLPM